MDKVTIKARRGNSQTQAKDINTFCGILNDVKRTDNREDVLIRAALATGYVNAMKAHALISEEELREMLDMIEEVGEGRLKELESTNRNALMRHFRKLVRK